MKPNFTFIALLLTILTGTAFSQSNQIPTRTDLTQRQIQIAQLNLRLAKGAQNGSHQFSDDHCKSHTLTDRYILENGLTQDKEDFVQQMHILAANWNPNMKMVSGPVPIIFHIVHNPNNPAENVSDAIITGLFNQLNDDFQLSNSDASDARSAYGFTPANVDISFCMAQQDPSGNPLATPGIERTPTSEAWFDSDNGEENKMKSSSTNGADPWDRTRYINVWICDITNGAMSGTAGYAYLPYTSNLPPAGWDGIVLDYNLGTYSGSRALTHEMGHFMGLNHTWEGTGSGTCGDDDGFSDTPFTSGPSFNQGSSCSGNQTYCNSIQTQYENFMDYSDCAVMYTTEQANYMNIILTGIRSSLLTSDGCNASSAPICGITSSATTIGAGGSVTFSNGSTGATSWSWDFDLNNLGGASPTTSTLENPGNISFSTQGTYTVELTATNSVGSTTCTQDITVTAPNCGISASTTTTTQNGNVTFTNASDAGTTSWSWNFDTGGIGGATPAASLVENPGSVTFGNLGTYNIELVTQFPGGLCTATATVIVSASLGCDTLLNISDLDTLTVYVDNEAGWNQYGDLTKVEKYTGYSPYSHVNGAAIYFYGVADGGNGATVDLVVYDDNAGLPGSLLGSRTYNLSNINTALIGTGGQGVLDLIFLAPVDVTSGTFYIGVGFNNFGTGDDLTVVHNSILDPTPNTAYEQWSDGTWHDMETAWYGTGYPWSLYISPYVTDMPVTGTASSNITTTCAGGSIDFSATGLNISGYNWYTTGGLPATSTNQSETVTYATDGNYTAYLVLDGVCDGQVIDSVQVVITDGPTTTATTTDPGCSGTDGQIVVAATGGSGPYTYSVDGGSTFQPGDTFTGLTDGSYDVVAEDVNGCQGTFTTILNPGSGTLPVSASTTDPGCANNDGQIVVSAAGGTGPYTFSIDGGSNFQLGDTFTDLAAGTYSIVSADGLGCQGTTSATLTTSGITLTVSSITTDPSCGANDGSIVTSVSGGTGSYIFSNNGGATFTAGTSPYTFSTLGTGTYSIVVEDANTCQGTESVTLSNATAPTETSTSSNLTCNNANDGSITTTATGTAPFNFSIDGGVNYLAGISPFTSTGLSMGTYDISVQDANGCVSIINSITITEPSPVSHTTTSTNASCGANNGTINVTATGGNNAYTYSNNNGASFQASGSFTGLAAITYQVIAMDGNGCLSNLSTETINGTGMVNTAAVAVNATCGDPNGSIVLTGTGGSAPYLYSIDGGATFQPTASFTGLSAGNYNVVIKDGNGCQGTNTSTVTNTGGFTPTISSNQTICFGNSATITSSGAGSGGTYTWDGGLGTGATQVASPASTTTYTVTMVDGNTCTETASVTITVETEPTVIITPSNPVICAGESVTLAGSGAQSYNWNTGATSASITVSPTNQTTYTVIGSNGVCQGAAVSTTISVNLAPVIIAGSDQTLIVAGGTINFSNAGSGATSYSWSFGDGGSSNIGSPSHTYTTAGTYTVILTGTLGNCSSSDTITINVGFTGLEEVNLEESVNLYPNPSSGEFNLSLNFAIKQDVEIRIFNTIGELLLSKTMNNTSSSVVEFNLNNNAEGFYFVNIKTNNESITKRISIIK